MRDAACGGVPFRHPERMGKTNYHHSDTPSMVGAEEMRQEIERRLHKQEGFYGFQPFLAQFLSEYPDLFLPYTELSGRLLLEPRHLSLKEMELASVAASAALGSEHCLNVHIPQARKVGASKEEIVEAVMVGCLMAMTKGQSIAFRKLSELE
ncbi:MAG TPA: carboxymuconolactone decarboxylase family protein [Methanomassiliicoccaceae archaeon]|nr:carboxymuconolactone decarboxylase family protein [Euryarchaeota archaeon]HOB38821.1 carboxymuconolactone decarboxylase family protein [Methanomassiliicoccaceae archaeon]HOL07914.1 carboxymuconolactone decarboxylase family protein [Methanomassiliicoccaceae archaeon]HPT73636.1 carboxymuconolactone decarboxylase family protein [Methanomassiliicoccaceae archaeon]HQA21283.1 carboxymuconolactone decarboxylase family protein [Methanomassiliicoccaceae archaeon]